jgi:hypothetical protein
MPTGFLATLLGTIVGAAIGAYVVGRFTEKGRQAAIKATFKEVLGQSESRAAAEERGKRLATHEDIENVLRELRLVTKETEQIKTEVSREAQTYLRAWEEKRNLYIQLVEWACERAVLVSRAGFSLSDSDFELLARSKERSVALLAQMHIFGSADVFEAWRRSGQGDSEPKPIRSAEWCDWETLRIVRLTNDISALARKELWGNTLAVSEGEPTAET